MSYDPSCRKPRYSIFAYSDPYGKPECFGARDGCIDIEEFCRGCDLVKGFNPEGPSTQHLSSLALYALKSMVLEPDTSNSGYLDPLGNRVPVWV